MASGKSDELHARCGQPSKLNARVHESRGVAGANAADRLARVGYIRDAHFRAHTSRLEDDTMSDTIEVFYSYSHADEKYREQLQKHLALLKRQKVITDWHDREISVGSEWSGEIDVHLNSAHVILLLISSDFLASDYCYDIELKRAMERHEAGDAIVIPIILRPCDWKTAPFGKLQGAPKDAKPVSTWDNQDEAFLDIALAIRKAVNALSPT